jgi:Tfp pilus assembly protein PilZ
MRFLTVVFATHGEFMAHFSDKYPNGALFCPTRAEAQLRAKVIVDVSIPGLRQPARLCGRVISHSSGRGMWVHFDAQSRPSVDYLTSLDDDDNAERLSRAHSRYPASLQVRCSIDETNADTDALHGKIVDLSRGGAFVSGSQVPLVGTRVSLDIGPLADSPKRFRVDGRVAWVGTVDEQDGFGVRFDQRGTKGAAPLRTMLRHASETGELYLD